MLNYEGFTKEGNWYKGNLHSHTTNSDGMLRPEEAVELFKSHGYSFLCFSEHDCYTDYRRKFNTDDFIILPGVEASAILYEERGSNNRLKVHHIHGILGTEKMQKEARKPLFEHKDVLKIPKYYGEWDGAYVAQALSDGLRDRGCITTYNHPIWSRVCEEEFIETEGLFALEIFNYNTVNESGTGYDTTHWDTMLRMGRQIYGFASDDNHNEGLFDDACGGYIVVKAPSLTHDHIIKAMLAGNYYSSAGPEIYDWGIKEGVAYIECSPVNRVNFIAGNSINAGMTVMCDNIDDTLCKAQFPLKGNESYLRIECTDKYGKTAWTNAVFLK
ncbi:MAG: PHP domain-containing protein [Lachnospiraceae bacterium]|nr:PHP domain-containing protein [Lachnospiraceae bacterium]MDD3617012.1 PHP domain-containing protein [Lachnospiraceae bacterium]